MSTRKNWTKGTGTFSVVKGLFSFTDGPKMKERMGAWSPWEICRKKAHFISRKIRYSLSGRDVCYLGVCLWNSISEKPRETLSVCSDSQAALKALQALRTSPLVHARQKALNGISTRHAVGLYWVLGRAGVRGNEIANTLARDGSVLKLVGPEPTLGVSR
jgi:hypothetical protein